MSHLSVQRPVWLIYSVIFTKAFLRDLKKRLTTQQKKYMKYY